MYSSDFFIVEILKAAMQGFMQKIVQMMKDERLFASQGGPIILAQVMSFIIGLVEFACLLA